jgi:ABC-type transport system involved in cytochrome c biogenesis permease subunit
MDETWLLRAALGLYGAAATGLRWQRLAACLLGGAVALHGLSLASRWQAHGHGPFTTMHEILSSNLWSLALVCCVAAWALRELRTVLVVAWPLWLVMAGWLLLADNGRGHFPPTYATPLLYLHTLVGKLFLGLLLVAVVLGSVPALRRVPPLARALGGVLAQAPADARLDELAHRFSAFAFIAHTLMLIVGAVWAQDAWGRWWAWDPLESWAFVSWLALAATLHARATLRPRPLVHGLWLAGCFVLAFLTFFGVPFLSLAPHKGAI